MLFWLILAAFSASLLAIGLHAAFAGPPAPSKRSKQPVKPVAKAPRIASDRQMDLRAARLRGLA